MESDSELQRIADCFIQELQERYPRFVFIRRKLQAPGYAVVCIKRGDLIKNRLFMVKVITNGVLFDIENRRDLPYFNESVPEGMILRKLEIDFGNPKMVDLIFESADELMAML